jgi:site-specific DNA-methyltransferase (adenine-specific)
MKPYYKDEFVTLYNENSLPYMKTLESEFFDVVITDPPYSERTHKNAKKNDSTLGYGVVSVDFNSFTEENLLEAYNELGRITKGWIISTIDYNHAFTFETKPPAGLVQKRIGVWVKNNPMPQISADRPAQGWECISYLHRKDKKSVWNGGGSHGNYVSNLSKPTGHPTPKPLNMVSSFVERFSNIGDTVFDPFAGGGLLC